MIQTEKLSKAKKLAGSLGVSLSDLADVVAGLQEVRESDLSLSLDQFSTADEVMQTLVAALLPPNARNQAG